MLLISVALLIPGAYCLYNMYQGDVIAALGGGLTANGLIALYGFFELRNKD